MPRAGAAKKRVVTPDVVYDSRLLAKIINRSMRDGEKTVAQKQVYLTLKVLQEKGAENPLDLLTKAIENIKPVMEVRPRRIGGAAYQVPQAVRGERRESLAIRWLITAARARPNKEYHTFGEKLAAEIQDAVGGQGAAMKKKNDMHRAAEANKAFAHFRW
jgi:small subunit ribosomal protein S7